MLEIYESILRSQSVGMLLVNPRGVVLFVNEAAKQMLNLGSTTRVDQKVLPLDWGNIRGLLRDRSYRLNIVDLPGAGTKVMVHSSMISTKDREPAIMNLFFDIGRYERDISQKMDSLRRIPSDLEAVIENTYDGLYITDGEANTIMVNKAYERITGIRREEILGKNMRDLVAKKVFDRSVSLEVIDKREPITIMQELRGGKKVLVTGSPVYDEDGRKLLLVVTNVRDITELIEVKEKLHERTLEANRYLAELDTIKMLQHQRTRFAAKSKKMLEILDTAIKAAQFDSNILITGESGVGKGLMARLIHETSLRKGRSFVTVNCASIPDDLFESELFGYEPGAFSGASVKGKKGLLEVADGGTVFLDEIGDMSLRLQAKLLRVIEEKEMVRLGSTKTIKLNVRVIAATNQDLNDLIASKRFRQDLYFRLNTISILIPPLRERREDVIPLLQYFARRLKERYGVDKEFSPKAIQFLVSYDFPGNVRELSNIVEHAFLISQEGQIDVKDLPVQVPARMEDEPPVSIEAEGRSYVEIVNLMEYKLLKSAVAKYGSTHKAARSLGISQSTIVRKLKKLGLAAGYDKGVPDGGDS